MERIVVSSFVFSLTATILSLARILRSYKENQRKKETDLILKVTNLVRIIEDEKFIQSRKALKNNSNELKDVRNNNNNNTYEVNLIFEIDAAIEEAVRV